MNAATVAEALRQVIEGMDFADAKRLVNIKADLACKQPEGFPYSIATNIWHCDYWNRLWLARLQNQKRPAGNIWTEDWQVPTAEEWPETKKRFLENLNTAWEIARGDPLVHSVKSDEVAIQLLNQIAVHTAYHVGQVALLKRVLKSGR